MMKRISLAALAALSLLCGCRHTEEEIPDSASVRTVRFLAGTADTRTAFAEAVNGVYQTLWTSNDSDVLLSLNYAKAESSAITVSQDGKNATFEAAFDASSATAPYTFYAVSPASAARAISPSRSAWSVYIAADQKPLAGSVDEAAQLLVAKSAAAQTLPAEVRLHFSHLTAYGRITLKNLSLGDATVRKAELVFSTPVVGEWYWAEDGTLTTANGASHTITLDTDASGDLWFACAPVDVSGESLTLSLYTDQGVLSKTIEFPSGRKFNSGKVARFSVDMDGIQFSGGSVYTLLEDETDLQAGCEVVFLNAAGDRAMGAQTDNYRSAETSGFSLSGKELTVTGDNVTVFTVEAGTEEDSWSFREAGGYLAATNKDKNHIRLLASKNDFGSWYVGVGRNGSADVQAVSVDADHDMLRYNNSSPRFSCYESGQKAVKIYVKEGATVLDDDPLAARSEYGCYLGGTERTYVKGEDQLVRSYTGGTLQFVILNATDKEQLVVSGYDPSLAKGGRASVTVQYRRGVNTLLDKSYTLTVVREDGPKVWLGDGAGNGIILKK